MANSAVVGLLRALLVADTAKFDAAMKRSGDAAKTWGNSLKQTGEQAKKLGTALTETITLPIIGIGAAASKMAMDFESSFAGVRKTVDASEQELSVMAQSFRDLAKQIPINVNELNRLGEAAGALNVPKESIVDFVKVMAELGATTNVTSDEAAASIAKIQTVFQSAGKETENFGSTLVALGNKGASTEHEILEMATRIASAGRAIGLSQAQVLGFASALANVGIEAEAGGTAISKVFAEMSMAVSQGGKALAQFAQYTTLSAEQFAVAFRRDAADAVNQFIVGLGNAARSGGDLNLMLSDLGITEVRQARALRDLALSGDNLSKSLGIANDAWRSNTALSEAAQKRFETTAAQLTILWNKIKDVGITLGNALLPAIKSLTTAIGALLPFLESVAKFFAALPGPMQAVVIGFLGLAAAIGPVVWGFGQLLTSAGAISLAFGKTGIATRLMQSEMWALAGQIGLVVAALGLLGYAVYAIVTHESALEKELNANSGAFQRRTRELDEAEKTYQRLSQSQNRTAAETAELERVTRILASASGLTVDAFKKEMEASDNNTKAIREQIKAYQDLEKAKAEDLRRTRDKLLSQQAELAGQLKMVQQGKAFARGDVGFEGGVQLRPMETQERLEAIEELNTKIKANQQELEKANHEYNVFIGVNDQATGAVNANSGATGQNTGQVNSNRLAHATLTEQLQITEAALAKLTATQKQDIEAGVKMHQSSTEIAKTTKIAVEVVDMYIDRLRERATVQRQATKETEKDEQAQGDLVASMDDLLDVQVKAIKQWLELGRSHEVIAKAFAVSKTQVDEIAQSLDREQQFLKLVNSVDKKITDEMMKRAEELAKQTIDNLKKIQEAEQTLQTEREDRAVTYGEQQRRDLAKWAKQEKDAFRGSEEQRKEYYDKIDAIVVEREKHITQDIILQEAIRRAQAIKDEYERHKAAVKAAADEIINTLISMGNRGTTPFHQIANAIGVTVEAMEKIRASGASVAGGLKQLRSNTEDASLGWEKLATSILNAVAAALEFGEATSSRSKGKNILGGAMKGAEIGTMILPGWGTFFGGLVGGIVGAFRDGHKATRKEVVAWVEETYGSFDELHKKLATLGAKGEQLWVQLTQGSAQQNADAMKQITATFAAYDQMLSNARGKVSDLQSALQVFGGVVPASLRPTVESLLQMAGLPDDIRQSLQGITQDPSWQTLQSKAETLGISLEALGPKFQQARIGDIALGYVRDINMFADSGANMDKVMEGMSDELSTMYQEAKKTGAALPETLKPWMQKLVDAGLLVDENGEKIQNLDDIAFKDIEDTALNNIVNILKEIKDLLSKGLPQAAQSGAEEIQHTLSKPIKIPYTFEQQGGGPEIPQPQLQSGTHGQFVDWGDGTSVTLHGKEAVVPEGQGLNPALNITVVSKLDGREVARNQVRYLPGELALNGL